MTTAYSLPEGISSDPEIRSGALCIPGTRFPVARILAELGNGMSAAAIADDYSQDRETVLAAIRGVAALIERWPPRPSSAAMRLGSSAFKPMTRRG